MRTIMALLLMAFMSQSNADDAMVIQLDRGERTFQVSLPANSTTGYQWTVKQYDRQLLNLISSKYTQAKSGLMGAGGVMVYGFKLKSGVHVPKKTELLFCYARPWEKNDGSLTTVTVHFSE